MDQKQLLPVAVLLTVKTNGSSATARTDSGLMEVPKSLCKRGFQKLKSYKLFDRDQAVHNTEQDKLSMKMGSSIQAYSTKAI